MAEKTSKILDRIAKLMKMADGGTKHEAEVAAKMAQAMLLKHNLSMSDVNNNIDEDERAIMDEFFGMKDTWKKVEGNWISTLYHVVAINNLCKIIVYGGGKWKDIRIIGSKANVSMVNFICMQLIPRLRDAEKQEWSWYNGFDNRNVFKRGFFQGAVAGINQQLSEALDKMRDEDKNINGLVLYNDKAVTEYRDKKWPHLGKSRGSRSSSYDGYQSGKNVGSKMNIRQGVGGSKNNSTMGGMLGKGK